MLSVVQHLESSGSNFELYLLDKVSGGSAGQLEPVWCDSNEVSKQQL